MARKNAVDGMARKIIASVDHTIEPALVIKRFSKVCGMLQDPKRAEKAFAEHGKADVLNRARRQLQTTQQA